MPDNPSSVNLSMGVHVSANIDLCRRILTGVRKVCEDRNLNMNVLSDSGHIAEFRKFNLSRMPPLAGIVAHICHPFEFEILEAVSPFVVGTSNRYPSSGKPRVINDEVAIGRMGADYLLSIGLRRLVFLNKTSMQYSSERRDGFLSSARHAGAAVECIDFRATPELAAIGKNLLTGPLPLGVMADSDYSARALIETLPDYRKLVPHRIAVLGVDDDSLQNALSPISLSSVRTGGHEIGIRAAELALHLRAGLAAPDHPIRIRPIRAVERASTNVLAIEDPVVARTIRLLRDHIGEFRDVKDVVAALNINRRSLEIRFRKALNRSIATELTQARLRSARHLLESTDLTIGEVAELVGYPEYRLLTLAFQRITGEPPTAYRKRVRGG